MIRCSLVRPRRPRRCVGCERMIINGVLCCYVVDQVDGVGFRYGYCCETCSRQWGYWPKEAARAA